MLEIKNLSASYGTKKIFSNLSFALPENKITALCGINGSGKSTLLSLATGIIPLGLEKTGSIFIDKSEVFKNTPKENAKKISLLVQNETNIWDITVEQLISDGRFVHRKWFSDTKTIDEKAIYSSINALGLNNLRNRNIRSLSGGEYQRVRIARSIAQETPYIFLDEPLNALDVNHQKELMELLKNLCTKGKTIFLSIHDINIASIYANNIVMLHKDNLNFSMGTPNEIMTDTILEKAFGTKFQIFNHPITGAKQIF